MALPGACKDYHTQDAPAVSCVTITLFRVQYPMATRQCNFLLHNITAATARQQHNALAYSSLVSCRKGWCHGCGCVATCTLVCILVLVFMLGLCRALYKSTSFPHSSSSPCTRIQATVLIPNSYALNQSPLAPNAHIVEITVRITMRVSKQEAGAVKQMSHGNGRTRRAPSA